MRKTNKKRRMPQGTRREKAIVIDEIKPWSRANGPVVGRSIPVGQAFRWDPDIIKGKIGRASCRERV